MIFCSFHKILMIFTDLGLQYVSQVFNIFENVSWVLSGRLGDQRKIIFWVDYNDSCEKNVRSCLKVSKNMENHVKFSNTFWSEAGMLGANSKM